jgi:hypothetical protein
MSGNHLHLFSSAKSSWSTTRSYSGAAFLSWLPPWVPPAWPSSLFHHFYEQIRDIWSSRGAVQTEYDALLFYRLLLSSLPFPRFLCQRTTERLNLGEPGDILQSITRGEFFLIG